MSRYTLDWSFGLVNSAGMYLTCETFQKKVGCTGKKLGKKQILFLEAGAEGTVSLRTHLGNYIRVDGDGKFLADGEKGDEETNIIIEAQPDGTWLLKSAKYGWYLGGSGENLTAFITEATADRFWKVHLAMHPQITLKNVARKRYVHLVGDVLNTDADMPWGENATLNLVHNDGCYQIQGVSGGFLEDTGRMTEDAGGASTLFILDFHGDVISFKSKKSGKYLTSLGASGLLKATKPGITKDEQFQMEDSWPQVSLQACKSGKFLSTKQGVEIAATADEVSHLEIYQIEPQDDGTWIFKTSKDKFLESKDGGLCSGDPDCTKNDPAADNKFQVEFLADNKIALTGSNGKYVRQKMNKYIDVQGAGSTEDDCQFVMTIVNRPSLCLRGSFGFINMLEGSGTLECNKSEPQYFAMSQTASGYEIDGWTSSDNLINGAGGGGESYHIELLKESKMAIKFDGKYLAGQQTGEVTFSGTSINKDTTWEY
jgi:hypothetical protein